MTYTGLYLGSLHLTGTAGAGYKVETLAEGTDFGNPEPVEAAVQSLLQDGDLVEHLRDGNRAQNLRIRITGTAAQLQLGEAALMAELYKANTLTVPPLLAGGATTVFDIVTSSLNQIVDDLAEVQANQWHYSVRLVSRPFGRSTAEDTLTPTPTSIGTARQQIHTVTAAGSARTEPAFTVASTVSLGEVLAYFYPDDGRGYSPPLRQYATSATTAAATTDTAILSGKRNMIDTAAQFDVPLDTLHDGGHLLIARARASAPGAASITWDVETRIGSTVLTGTDYDATTVSATFADGSPTAWEYVLLGKLSLPLIDVGDPATAVLRFTFSDLDTSGLDIDLDEVYLFNTTIGALFQVDCGTGTAASGGPSRRLFYEPPTVTHPTPRLLRGHATDMSDAFNPGSLTSAWGAPSLSADDDTKVLTVTPNTTSSALTVRRWKRWHTHAGS